MPSRQKYRLRWLQKQLDAKEKVEVLLAELKVKSKTLPEQRQKIKEELLKIDQENANINLSK